MLRNAIFLPNLRHHNNLHYSFPGLYSLDPDHLVCILYRRVLIDLESWNNYCIFGALSNIPHILSLATGSPTTLPFM